MSNYFNQFKEQKILFFVLNWGLGHASRSISIIDVLLRNGNEVILISSCEAKKYLKIRFSSLVILSCPDYEISYAKNAGLTHLKLLFQLPKILYKIKKEHLFTKSLIKQYKPDILISDSCYGAYNKNVNNYFITHQLTIQSRFFNQIINFLHFKMLSKFDRVLVPDYSNHLLSGNLSHIKYSFQYNLLVDYIGPLSRFGRVDLNLINKSNECFDFAIVSGPEPQKTQFLIFLIFKHSINCNQLKIALGGDYLKLNDIPNNVTIINNMNDDEFMFNVINANNIISRSGYTSLMDLYCLNSLNKAIFYPTKGQTEQEYLAKYYQTKKAIE